jgi:DNA-binding MarR family transcriptional regulator
MGGEQASAVEAWEALFRAQVTVLRDLHREFPTDQLSFNEYDVLFNLSRQTGRQARIRDLNKQLLLTQPSVSRLLDRLAARGLIEKTADPDDRRGTIVRMTDAGYELYHHVAVQHAATIGRRVGGALDAEELEALAAISDKLRRGASI